MTDQNDHAAELDEAEDLQPEAAETDEVVGGSSPAAGDNTDGTDRMHKPL